MKKYMSPDLNMLSSKIIYLLIFIFIHSFTNLNCRQSKFLFDDFNYQSVKVFKNIDSSGSMFSRNIWKSDKGDTTLKAWFKYNTGDLEFSPESEIKLNADGFILNINPSTVPNNAIQPLVMSSFLLKYGTYVTLCKFSEYDERDKITQAYWLESPLRFIFSTGKTTLIYRDEIDFEWNNWWEGDNKYVMPAGATMRNSRRPSFMYLNCILRDSLGNTTNLPQCIIPFTGKPVITDRWGLCIFVIDSAKNCTRFGIYFPDNGNGFDIWAGDNYLWGNYFTINNYSAYHPQIVVYQEAAGEVHADCPFEVDWFYYDARTDIDYSEILNIVNGF